MKELIVSFALMSLAAGSLCAEDMAQEFTAQSVFSSHMVLQREHPISISGTAASGKSVHVEFAGQKVAAVGDSSGKWAAVFPAMAAGGPYTLTVTGGKGSTPIKFEDVLVGEVWVCSGQSNMEWPLDKSLNAGQEVAAAAHPSLRLFQVPRTPSDLPMENLRGASWAVCSPESAAKFSAVGYFFGRELNSKLGVPVGLINSSWGGSSAEHWMTAAALAGIPETVKPLKDFQARAAAARATWSPGINQDSVENTGLQHGWASFQSPADGDWRDMELPATWQQRGLDVSGVFWFRKEVDVPAEWANRPLKLAIGATDKEDITYFNGEKVGSVCEADNQMSYSFKRVYDVPGNLVKAGRNVIAVRVRSDFFDGGMTGPADFMQLSCPSLDVPAKPLAGIWRYAIESNYGFCHPGMPTELFNGIIRPLLPLAIRGVIWYQGESNTTNPELYKKLLPALIANWRSSWNQGDFPFHIVQLHNWDQPAPFQAGSKIAALREAQALALSVPNTAMTVTIDIGEVDCHFKNKQAVGQRLAASALAKDYGMKDIPCQGPIFKAVMFKGSRAVVSFDNPSGGLVATGGGPLQGFHLAGADGVFHPAKASIDGETVVLDAPEVPVPKAARYAWADNPICNLHNQAGFPAAPFRTDN